MSPETSKPIPEELDKFRRLELEGEVQLQGSSMEPTIPAGATIRLRGGIQAPEVGDVVGYWDGCRVVVHRVRCVTSKDGRLWFQAQGDANTRPDDWLAVDHVVGRVVRFPRRPGFLGRLAVALRKRGRRLHRQVLRRVSGKRSP